MPEGKVGEEGDDQPRAGAVLRNTARGLIVRDAAILLQVCRVGERVFHLLPGGGQQPGESLVETVQREVLEETGLTVRVERLLWLREFIARNHATPADPRAHSVDAIFRCTPKGEAAPAALLADDVQIGLRWVGWEELPGLVLHPQTVQRLLIAHGPALETLGATYLGDCL